MGFRDKLKPNSPAKKVLFGVIVLLLAALGFESFNTDYDLGKAIQGEDARVYRDAEGNVVPAGTSGAKATDDYNCDDFTTQLEAQNFFVTAGGPSQDTNRLDGDNDGDACEGLPKGTSNETY